MSPSSQPLVPEAMHFDKRLLQIIVCPRDHTTLREEGNRLVCERDHTYGVVDGVPVLLCSEVPITHCEGVRARQVAEGKAEVPTLPSTINEQGVVEWVSQWIAATNGIMYVPLIGKMREYPIPNLRLPPGEGRWFLEIGCSWGRWCVAAARAGYLPLGIDPSLNGIRAARRVALQLGIDPLFVVADGALLPLRSCSMDQAFSYSVLQHLSEQEVRTILREIGRVLRPGGNSLIQMANRYGLRSLYHQARRGFRATKGFEVRYWSPSQLLAMFSKEIGISELEADGYFSLNAQLTDARFLPTRYRLVIHASEWLRRAGRHAPFLMKLADSIYIRSTADRPEGLGTRNDTGAPL